MKETVSKQLSEVVILWGKCHSSNIQGHQITSTPRPIQSWWKHIICCPLLFYYWFNGLAGHQRRGFPDKMLISAILFFHPFRSGVLMLQCYKCVCSSSLHCYVYSLSVGQKWPTGGSRVKTKQHCGKRSLHNPSLQTSVHTWHIQPPQTLFF